MKCYRQKILIKKKSIRSCSATNQIISKIYVFSYLLFSKKSASLEVPLILSQMFLLSKDCVHFVFFFSNSGVNISCNSTKNFLSISILLDLFLTSWGVSPEIPALILVDIVTFKYFACKTNYPLLELVTDAVNV